MFKFRNIMVASIVLSLLLLVLYVNRSHIIASYLSSQLQQVGAKKINLVIAGIDANTTYIKNISFEIQKGQKLYTFSTNNIKINYTLVELVKGYVESITLTDTLLHIREHKIKQTTDYSAPVTRDNYDVSSLLKIIPIRKLLIKRLQLNISSAKSTSKIIYINGNINSNSHRLQVAMMISSEGHGQQRFDLQLSQSNGVEISLSDINHTGIVIPYLKAKSSSWLISEDKLKAATSVDIDIKKLQQVLSSWNIPLLPEKSAGRFIINGILDYPLQKITLADNKPWWQGRGQLEFDAPTIPLLGNDIHINIPFEASLHNGSLQWQFSDQAEITLYPQLTEKITNFIQQPPQLLTVSSPKGAKGILTFNPKTFQPEILKLNKSIQVQYGDATTQSFDAALTSFKMMFQPSFHIKAGMTYTINFLKNNAFPLQRFHTTGTAQLSFDNKHISLSLPVGNKVSLHQVNYNSIKFKSATAELKDAAYCEVTLSDSTWSCMPFNFKLTIDEIKHNKNYLSLAPINITVKELHTLKKDRIIKLAIDMPHWLITLGEPATRIINLDGINTNVSIHNDDVTLQANINAAGGDVKMALTANYSLQTRQGKIRYKLAPIYFEKNNAILEKIFNTWPNKLIIDGGNLRAQGVISLPLAGKSIIRQHGNILIQDLQGRYNDITFKGLNTELIIDGVDKFKIKSKQALTLQSLDTGVLISDISLQAEVLTQPKNKPKIILRKFISKLLGGEVSSKHIVIDLAREENFLNLRINGIDIKQLLALEKQQVFGTGLLDGDLPLVLKHGQLSLADGKLVARQPGGKLRYIANERIQNFAKSNPDIKLLLIAMKNFNYHLLETTVNYTPNGILKLQVQLEGSNSELENSRVVHLNINIEDNILTLLRSLRLAEEISERLKGGMQQH